jgi:iron complex outermembrane receptor protein
MFVSWSSRKALLSSISALALPLAVIAAPHLARAAEAADAGSTSIEELVVTATRRDTTIQDTPVNIAAVGTEQIKQQGFNNLGEITRFVPGVFVIDHGARDGNTIVVRGLNATGIGAGGNNDGGGTVATYLGDIPLFVDLKLNDMDRVEFLLGPQGTLYGAGTLGGAIRYIPTRPKLGVFAGQVRGDVYGYTHGSNPSSDVGFTINLPIGDKAAFRMSLDNLNDTGFIDQPYLVKTVGVSNPDPNFSNPAAVAANLYSKADVNTERTLSGRAALRWQPTDKIDLNLTYYYQDAQVGGRQVSGSAVSDFPVPVDQWESVKRVTEPNRETNKLLALEGTFDLGFAQLTSATGVSRYHQLGRRDQTDLLIGLEYSYEAFPSFTAFTEEREKDKGFTQELRLVSKGDSALSWIVGGYYNKKDIDRYSKEFTPHYDQYLVDIGFGTQLRPDSIEYYSPFKSKLTEEAAFGELSYQITPAWQITGGARYYKYDYKTQQAVDIPLFNTVVLGRTPIDALITNWEVGGQKDNGWLFKFNTSYKFSDDVMTYLTVSEGYRIGSSNGVGACPDPLPGNQIVCALPNELEYTPDKTTNYEIGVHSQWFNKRLTLNAALYYIQWKDPQVDSATKNGLQGITINGGNAESKGVEINANAEIFEGFTMRASYAHNESQFTATTLNLVPFITPPGFQSTIQYAPGEDGDRLPGSPQDQGSLFARYEMAAGSDRLAFNYSFTASGDVLTRTGNKGGGYVLPPWVVHNASVELAGDAWKATFYVDNIFDTFIKTGAVNTAAYNQAVFDDTGAAHYQRGFYYNVLPPRRIGIRVEREF